MDYLNQWLDTEYANWYASNELDTQPTDEDYDNGK